MEDSHNSSFDSHQNEVEENYGISSGGVILNGGVASVIKDLKHYNINEEPKEILHKFKHLYSFNKNLLDSRLDSLMGYKNAIN
jgi:hypothetical protein